MRHYILAGHARISEGMASAAELVLGVKVPYFNAYLKGEEPYLNRLLEEIETYPQDDEIVLMTDIFGGSVNNELMQLSKRPGVHLVSGVNLAFVIQMLLSDEKQDVGQVISECIREAADNMRYCNMLQTEEELDEF